MWDLEEAAWDGQLAALDALIERVGTQVGHGMTALVCTGVSEGGGSMVAGLVCMGWRSGPKRGAP